MSGHESEEAEQMRCALSAIADEVQKFHNDVSANETNEKILPNEDIFSAALVQCKSTLKLKQEQIRILRQQLKTACIVAKTLSAAKERETALLNNQLNNTRSEYWELVRQEKEKNKLIHELQVDNETVRDKLQYLNNFIQLGYRGLQNVHKEKLEDSSSLKQLQKIIFFCGQFYADYCNQLEKCKQVEQKNRFLNSRLRILEGHLEITSNELQNLSNKSGQNLTKKNPLSKSRQCSVCAVCSESQIVQHSSESISEMGVEAPTLVVNTKTADITCHLSTVKKLLLDQDALLKDLKSLSKETNIEFCMK